MGWETSITNANDVPNFQDPRILAEAIKLAFQKGLSIYYRPEVKQGTIGRTATTEEMYIAQPAFRHTFSSASTQTLTHP